MHARRDEELVLVCGDILTCVWTIRDHEICGQLALRPVRYPTGGSSISQLPKAA